MVSLCVTLLIGCAATPLDISENAELAALAPACAAHGLEACDAACEGGDAPSCLAAAAVYQEANVRGDTARMQAREHTACELGLALGCRYYANNAALALDVRSAAALRGCELSDGKSCEMDIAFAVGRVLNEGAPFHEVVVRVERACEVAPASCTQLANLEHFGIERPSNPERARALYQRACDAGEEANACYNLEHFNAPRLGLNYHLLFSEFHVPLSEPRRLQNNPRPGLNRAIFRGDLCFDSDLSFELRMTESSGVSAFDQRVLEESRSWRFVPSARFPHGHAFCARAILSRPMPPY